MQIFPFIMFGWTFFCALIFVICWIIAIIRSFKLNKYMKQYHYQKWEELTSIGQFGPGLSNPFKGIPYLFSNSYEKDELLLRLKNSTRISLKYSLIWFSLFILSMIIIFILMIAVQVWRSNL